jgi:hypothetical protein
VTVHRVASASALPFQWYRSYFLFRDSPAIAEGYGLEACAESATPCRQPGNPWEPFSEANRYSSPAITAGRLIASAQCDGPQSCAPRDPPSTGSFTIYRARISLADAFPPVFRAPPSGSLLDATSVVQGHREVSFAGTDLGGGIRAVEVMVDGEPVIRRPIAGVTCTEPYANPVPCPVTTTETIVVDTGALENGSHRIQLALVDAANNRTLSDAVGVTVHNDKGPNGANASRSAKLRAAFRTSRSAEQHLHFGARATVTGRLVDHAGKPIGGAELRIRSRIDRLGERGREVARIATKTNGRFRWRTPPGPSRFLRISYRAYQSDARATATAELKLSVRPAIALSVHPHSVRNGGHITFGGRLIGGPGRADTQIVLEAVGRRGRQRVPVATLRADRRGAFRFRYRFLRSFAPFTYRFRARLIPQASYPYTGGSSPIVTVRIVR